MTAPQKRMPGGGQAHANFTTSQPIVNGSDAERKDSDAHLAALPAQIDAAVNEAETHANMAVQAALKAGALFFHAKLLVPHGQFESWLTANCTASVRTAQAYMRLHSRMAELPAETRNSVALLPLREAMKAISTTPVAPPKQPSIYYPRRDRRDRVAVVLKRSADALRALTRNVGANYIKRIDVERTRAKLQAALSALDELQADDDVVDVEVQP